MPPHLSVKQLLAAACKTVGFVVRYCLADAKTEEIIKIFARSSVEILIQQSGGEGFRSVRREQKWTIECPRKGLYQRNQRCRLQSKTARFGACVSVRLQQ